MEKTFIEKLINVQTELKAPKNQYNKFGRFNYRSAEDILEAVKPLNKREGLFLTLSDEPTMIGDWHYIKATAKVCDETGHLFSVTAYAREPENKKGMDDSQITGSTSSYARKYALHGLYLIDDTKDADTNEHKEMQEQGENGTTEKTFKENKKECEERLKRVTDKKGKDYKKTKQWIISKINDDLNREDKEINPANISRFIGYIQMFESKLTEEAK